MQERQSLSAQRMFHSLVPKLLGVLSIKKLTFLLILLCAMSTVAYADLSISDENDFVLDVDYRTLGDDDDREYTLVQRVTLTNDGSSTESVSLTLSSDSSYIVDLDSATDQSFTLSPGEKKEVDLDIEVDLSDNIDGGSHEDVITLSVTENSGTTQLTYDADVHNMLLVDKIYFEINSQDEFDMDEDESDDGDVDLDVNPGDDVVITFALENLFDKDYKRGDLDVEIRVDLNDDDFGEDVDEKITFTLDADEKTDRNDEEFAIEFHVPEGADEDDDYDLEIKFEAEDENGAKFTSDFLAQLEVNRKKNDIRLNEVNLSQTELVCGGFFIVEAEVANFGSNNQDQVSLEIVNSDLGISQRENFALDQGRSSSKSSKLFRYEFKIPGDAKNGEYTIESRAFIDFNVLVDRDHQKITVSSCNGASSTTITGTTSTNGALDSNLLDTNGDYEVVEANVGTIETIEKNYTLEDFAVSLIIVFIVLVSLSVVLLVILGATRTPRRRR